MEVEAPRSVQDLLRASAAGLSISMSTDAAGTADLQVRGKNSLKAGSSPLLVLDGVIYDGSLQDINPMDIESIDVRVVLMELFLSQLKKVKQVSRLFHLMLMLVW